MKGYKFVNINNTEKERYILYIVDRAFINKLIKDAKTINNDVGVSRFKDTYGFEPNDMILWGDSRLRKDPEDVKKQVYKRLEKVLPSTIIEDDRIEHVKRTIEVEIKEDEENVSKKVESILPRPNSVQDLGTKMVQRSYKCFCCNNIDPDVPGHKTPLSAWECLMIRIGKPEQILVIRERV